MPDDNDLAAVNKCLLHFGVTMYRGADGRFRIWGDINRIQDIVDSDCAKTFPPRTLSDLDWFFTHEVDARIVRSGPSGRLRAGGQGRFLVRRCESFK